MPSLDRPDNEQASASSSEIIIIKNVLISVAPGLIALCITHSLLIMVAPPFGTASAYTDSFPAPLPKALTIAADSCFNLGVFKGELER